MSRKEKKKKIERKKKERQSAHPQPRKSKKKKKRGKRKKKKRKEKRKRKRKRQHAPYQKINGKRKKKEKKGIGYRYFCPLRISIFSLQFSLYFGENFLVGSSRKHPMPTIYFPSSSLNQTHLTKHTQKCFHFHFLSKVFHLSYFISKQTHPRRSHMC